MFDLTAYLRERAAAVDAELDRVLPPESEPPAGLHRAMRYSVLSGGKRLRAVLCLAAAEAAAPGRPAPFAAAAAVELLHAYTLVHDDLPDMDDDAERRGKPSTHVAFGPALAILAGDALQALAFETAARAPVPAPYPANQLVLELARAAGSRGVVGGQVEDLAADALPDPGTLRFIHEHKTADLFRAALRFGAVSAGAPPEALGALTEYGLQFGLAFQITDDLLDATPGYTRADAEDCVRRAHAALRTPALAETGPLAALADFVLERKA
ncbi:MAG: polyprenyl synthetase family protein [Lentisphaerae bacterium]|nr:polyprenyl synthetase family protein [Lentisphaerota bacterium]